MDPDYTFHLDPFGQQPGLWNLYTQLTWCYPMSNGTSQDTVVSTLAKGLERLSLGFPWVAGQVVKQTVGADGRNKEAEGEQNHAYYMIKSLESAPRLLVKDHRNILPSWSTYKDRRFPINLFDENTIAPRNTKPVSDESDPKPVFLLQATFITGGLLLTFSAQHGTLDIVGQGEVIRLFDKACNGIEFTSQELELGNRDRRTLVKLLTENEEQLQRDSCNGKKTMDTIVGSKEPPPTDELHNAESHAKPTSGSTTSFKNIWSNSSFSAGSLASLKTHAIRSTSILPSGFVSTDDVLSAFIWQCCVRARSRRYPSPSSTLSSSFARTVDVRRFLSIPPRYPGNLATKTHTTCSIGQLLQEPLGLVASALRETIDPKTSDLGYEARKSATEIVASLQPQHESKSSSKPQTERRRPRDLSKDIAFSSWSKIDFCWSLDFGLGLGMPESVRRPAFAPLGEEPMEGLVYLLPKRTDGEIGAVICLREDDMQRLKEDKEWNEFAEFIG